VSTRTRKRTFRRETVRPTLRTLTAAEMDVVVGGRKAGGRPPVEYL
jgi:hypothetical protein